jgi:hypothetical protein
MSISDLMLLIKEPNPYDDLDISTISYEYTGLEQRTPAQHAKREAHLIFGEEGPAADRFREGLDIFGASGIDVPAEFFAAFRKQTATLLDVITDGPIDRFVLASTQRGTNIDTILPQLVEYGMAKEEQIGRWAEVQPTDKGRKQHQFNDSNRLLVSTRYTRTESGMNFYKRMREFDLTTEWYDAPYTFVLHYGKQAVATISFKPVENGICIRQIQGGKGADALWGLHWERGLIKLVEEWAALYDIPEVQVFPYTSVSGCKEKVSKRQYDDPARREGYTLDSVKGVYCKAPEGGTLRIHDFRRLEPYEVGLKMKDKTKLLKSLGARSRAGSIIQYMSPS